MLFSNKKLILLLAIVAICSALLIGLITNKYRLEQEHMSHGDVEFSTDTPIVVHKPHTHEHEGLACCPCGLCHKHEDNKEHQGYQIKTPNILLRLSCAALTMCILVIVALAC